MSANDVTAGDPAIMEHVIGITADGDQCMDDGLIMPNIEVRKNCEVHSGSFPTQGRWRFRREVAGRQYVGWLVVCERCLMQCAEGDLERIIAIKRRIAKRLGVMLEAGNARPVRTTPADTAPVKRKPDETFADIEALLAEFDSER